jgi:hypothetical protein
MSFTVIKQGEATIHIRGVEIFFQTVIFRNSISCAGKKNKN